MNIEQLEAALRRSLDDFQLTRGERSAIRQLIDDGGLSPHELSVCRSAAFGLAREAMDAVRIPQVLEWLEDVTKLLSRTSKSDADEINEAWFSPGDRCVQKIRSLLSGAKKSVDICVFTITDDRISQSIIEAHQRHVVVRIITDNDKSLDPGSDTDRLQSSGVPLVIDQTEYHMHHKFAVFDGAILVNGSYNWTRSAATQNEENIIVTNNSRLVSEFSAAFEKLWQELSRPAS
ncbi:MAG: phospholipase D-like domain-containing protein [Planctomycetota bacterium]